jgi:hypothetical protein
MLPYDPVITAVNAANTRLNGKVETLEAIGGQIVGNTNSFSEQVVNNAWRKAMARLADLRFSELQAEVVFLNVPATASNDPVTQVYIDGIGYFDGLAVVAGGGPVLPAALIRPYDLSERAAGSGALFTQMDPLLYSLPRVPKANWNRQWLWRNAKIYMPGALVNTDIAMTYANRFADFVDGLVPWFQQQIPILNAVETLACYICQEIYIARKDVASAEAMRLLAEDAAALMCNQDAVGAASIQKAS